MTQQPTLAVLCTLSWA